MKSFDLVIIGGGICGMTAAIYAARANIRACILEQQVCGGLVNWTNTVENVPSYQSIHGIDLMEKCREHVESLNVAIEEVDKVTAVNFSGDIKKITTSMGEEYEAPAVIVATGRSPRPFPVETDFPNIHYCSVCDGYHRHGRRQQRLRRIAVPSRARRQQHSHCGNLPFLHRRRVHSGSGPRHGKNSGLRFDGHHCR